MNKKSEKAQHALDEALIIVTGAQLLVGFQYRSVFEKGYDTLPPIVRYLGVSALVLVLITLALIIAPVPYHRIVDRGHDPEGLQVFVLRVIKLGLLPFAVAVGIDIYIAGLKVLGDGLLAQGLGLASTLFAIIFWYVYEEMSRGAERKAGRHKPMREDAKEQGAQQDKQDEPNIQQKVDHVLTEARLVLPGALALLGFQFATVLLEGFDKLSQNLKFMHLFALMLITLSTILLMVPAAYHRIVEDGEDTEHFHRIASRFILLAMIPLALGVCFNFYVIVDKIADSDTFAFIVTALMLAFYFGLWYGYALIERLSKAQKQA